MSSTKHLEGVKYDDAIDALTLAVNKIIKDENQPTNQAFMVKMKESPYDAAIKQQPKLRNNIYSQSLDWADREDQESLRNAK